jgi:hypothetical protein
MVVDHGTKQETSVSKPLKQDKRKQLTTNSSVESATDSSESEKVRKSKEERRKAKKEKEKKSKEGKKKKAKVQIAESDGTPAASSDASAPKKEVSCLAKMDQSFPVPRHMHRARFLAMKRASVTDENALREILGVKA